MENSAAGFFGAMESHFAGPTADDKSMKSTKSNRKPSSNMRPP